MSQYVGEIPLGDTVPFPFDTYDSNGGSVTITGLAVTDIEVFKDGSITQRSSDNGYALLDTDGIDFDSRTGLHGFSIDTSDNSDSGFYAAGSYYWVHVDAITVDSQTVRFTFWFRMVAAENVAGVKPSDVTHFGGSAGTFASGRPEVNASHLGGTSQTGRDIGASVLLSPGTGTGQISLSSGTVTVGTNNDKTGYSLTNLTVQASTTLATGTHTAQTGDAYAYLGTNLGAAGANATEAGGNGDHLTEAGGTGDQFTGLPDVTLADGVTHGGSTANLTLQNVQVGGTFNIDGAVTFGSTFAVSDTVTFVSGLAAAITGNITGNLSGSVGSVTAGVTVTTNNDKTGYALSSTGLDSTTLPANLITASSIAANAFTSAKFASDYTDRLETDILAILEGNAVTDFTAMPASTPTYSEALGMVAAAILNKVISDRTAGKSYIHDGDNNVIGEATITDDGDTFTRTKYAAP